MPPTSTRTGGIIAFLFFLFFGARSFAQPVINSFTPDSGTQGTHIYISGKYFTGATAVSFGGVSASSFFLEGDTAIVAIVGSGATGDVVVTTSAGSDSVSGFTWKTQAPPPAVYSFTPASGTTGDTVLITGHNLTTVNGVAFGGVPAASYGSKNDSVVWAVVGYGASGVVAVTNPGGSASEPGFTFIASTGPLHLIRFFPDSATAGDAVYIYGQHLDSLTSVSLGNIAARSFTTEGDTLLIAIVDTGASGKILVSGEWGIDSLSGFRYIGSVSQDTTPTTPPPTVSTFQLQQFIGIDSTEGVLLFWNTLYDQKMQDYLVFGGQDSTNLSELGTITSLKQNTASYSYSANLAQGGVWYFQLRMEDTTAAFTNSPVISVTHRANTLVVNGYPNPTANQLTVAIPSNNSPSSLQMVDPTGRVVKTIVLAPNTLQVTIDVSGLNNGVYRLAWSDGKHKTASSVLVVK